MLDFASAVLGALVVVALAFARWVYPRATRKGRLLLELGRLGEAHSRLPDGDQKDRLASHLDAVGANLNDWLDPINRWKRNLQAASAGGLYLIAVVLVYLIAGSPGTPAAWIPWTVGAGTGVVMVVLFAVTEWRAAARYANRERMAAQTRQAKLLVKHEADPPVTLRR